ncbi:MAG: recombinase family protein [Planctomycetota bacterium]
MGFASKTKAKKRRSIDKIPPALISVKNRPAHQELLALIYVRQSSTKQVEENVESTELQYQLVDRALAMGWSNDRIEVIDDDLGMSGRGVENRIGFQRMIAEVSLGHVGIIISIEMSRLARSCRDWHQLLENCSLFGTLLADADGVYDPRDHNDRLLLGLKGTMRRNFMFVKGGSELSNSKLV